MYRENEGCNLAHHEYSYPTLCDEIVESEERIDRLRRVVDANDQPRASSLRSLIERLTSNANSPDERRCAAPLSRNLLSQSVKR